MSLRLLGTPIIKAVSSSERKSAQTLGEALRALLPMSLASVSKTATSSALVWAYCPGGEPTVTTQSQWEYHTHTQRWKGKRPFLPADNYSILARHFARSNRAAPGKLWVSVTVIFVELIIGMQGGWNESQSRNEEVRKKEEDGRGRRLRCRRTVWGSWGVSGGMLIGLWGAEPQQINSSEWIMARADIRPPPHPTSSPQHTFSSYYSQGKTWWWRRAGKWAEDNVWLWLCERVCVTEFQRESVQREESQAWMQKKRSNTNKKRQSRRD